MATGLAAAAGGVAAWMRGHHAHTAIPGLDQDRRLSRPAPCVGDRGGGGTGVANSDQHHRRFQWPGIHVRACIMLTALAYVAFQVGDVQVGTLALAGIGAVLGFFLWNFPGGMIFLGDGGAYLLGFYVAEVSILLLVRNPTISLSTPSRWTPSSCAPWPTPGYMTR
jgi:hypothetical protein